MPTEKTADFELPALNTDWEGAANLVTIGRMTAGLMTRDARSMAVLIIVEIVGCFLMQCEQRFWWRLEDNYG
jgi:hypothetical protein